ncbi:MAG TPA: PPC domain-containing protein [Longimicrobium sp.]|nr:PPC domain-containing protein [Longimicrobium sp.]
MHRTLLLALLATAAAAPAAAQGTIQPGQRVTGQLTASDPTLDDGSHYDVWRFQGQAEHRYRVTLRSDDFDAYLAVGSRVGGECDGCRTDDDGAGGTDALVEFIGRADGTYEIRANSYDADEVGGYELMLEDEGIADEPDGPADTGIPITLDRAVEGELARGDEKAGSSYTDTYTYRGRAGETITIRLDSEEFDTYVEMGQVDGGECTDMDANDDGGEGTNSLLTVTLPDDGAYHIHVRSSGPGETGAYTLLVQGAPAPAAVAVPPSPIAPDEVVQGRLSAGDAREPDGAYGDVWAYRGSEGETITIVLRSEDFDAYLSFGRMVDGEWAEMESDDDGAGDLDSEITITLPQGGEYLIRATSLTPDETGAYTLRVARH